MSDILNAKVEAYYAARRAYDSAKKLSNEADQLRRQKESELVGYMIENQIKGVDREDGTKPSLVNSVSISCTAGNHEAIREWLRETVGDDTDFMVTVVSKPAVLELVKKKIKEGDDASDFPAFLETDTRPTLRVTGWKGVAEE